MTGRAGDPARRASLLLISLLALLVGCGSSAGRGAPSAGTSSAQPLVGAAPAVVAQFPIDVADAGHGLIISVAMADPAATTGTLTGWQGGPDGWTAVVGPAPAFVGAGGVGQASEGSSLSPAGRFGLSEAFGIQPNPGARLPQRR